MTLYEQLPIIASVLLPSVLLILTLGVRKPGWHHWTKWTQLNLVSYFSSVLLGISVSLVSLETNIHYVTAIMLASSVSILTYTFVQSLTDVKTRKVDRATLQLSFWLMLPISFLYYLYHLEFFGYFEFIAFLVALSLGGVFRLLQRLGLGMGASDIRAIMLMIVAGIPAIGVEGISIAMVFYVSLFVVFIIYMFSKYRLKVFHHLNDYSIPAVPILLFPILALTLYAIADILLNLSWLPYL